MSLSENHLILNPTETLTATVKSQHQRHFGIDPELLVLSPGRINLLGEHVDYNDGFVLPGAIDKYICLSLSGRNDDQAHILSLDFEQTFQFGLWDDLSPTQTGWANFFIGVWAKLRKPEMTKGFNVTFSSTIPMGAGMSSSAALSCGFAYLVNTFFDLGLDWKEIAWTGQFAERKFAGVNCGIMDQGASAGGKENHLLKLDCRDLSVEQIQIDLQDCELLLLDSGVKHSHLSSGYNTRRQEVEEGLAILSEVFPGHDSFRTISPEMCRNAKGAMSETVFKRCEYVTEEISRVEDAVAVIREKNLPELGKLMFETHDGLSRKFEISCPELDFLVDDLRNFKGVLGARMMGGGFGGCAIVLVKKEEKAAIVETVSENYLRKFGIRLKEYDIKLVDGTHLIEGIC